MVESVIVTLIFDLIRYIIVVVHLAILDMFHFLPSSIVTHEQFTLTTSVILEYLTFPFRTWRGFLIRTYLPTFTFDTLAPGLLCSDFVRNYSLRNLFMIINNILSGNYVEFCSRTYCP